MSGSRSAGGQMFVSFLFALPAEPRAAEPDLDVWFRQYGEAVFRRCCRLMRSEAAGSDMLQETFMRAHKYKKTFRGDAKPMTWLFSIADRCCFDAMKKDRKRGGEVAFDDVAGLLESENRPDASPRFKQDAVARLLTYANDDDRAIVVHRYFDEMSYEDIADHVGLSERHVRRRHAAFLASMRARFFDAATGASI